VISFILGIILELLQNFRDCSFIVIIIIGNLEAFAWSSLRCHQVGYFTTDLHVPDQRCFTVSGNQCFVVIKEIGIA
jgi:hypothetical protein